MQKRFSANGAKDLQDVMKNYKMLPPKQNTQTLIQGGVICFDGKRDVFFHKVGDSSFARGFVSPVLTLSSLLSVGRRNR